MYVMLSRVFLRDIKFEWERYHRGTFSLFSLSLVQVNSTIFVSHKKADEDVNAGEWNINWLTLCFVRAEDSPLLTL